MRRANVRVGRLHGCPVGQTCLAGACKATLVTEDELSPWTEPPPGCFDVHACLRDAEDITRKLDAGCVYTMPEADAARTDFVNVASEALPGQGGVCGATPDAPCLVGLTAGGASGFFISAGKVQLPERVCQLLASGEAIARVWLSRGCPTRAPTQPACTPWLTPPAAPSE